MTRSAHVAALLTVAVLAAGCAANNGALQPAHHSHTGTRPANAGSSSAPSPARSRDKPRHLAPFANIRRYLATRSGQVTAALYDARSGQTWVLHPAQRDYTASIVKVEIMGTALREAQNVGRRLPAYEKDLMVPMIEASDNQSATTLLADVGGPKAVGRFDRSVGMYQTIPSTMQFIPGTDLPGWGLTTTSALDEVKLVSTFAFHNSILTDGNRNYGLDLMEHIEAGENWGVPTGVPAGTTVAVKNGWVPIPPTNYWQINTIGWVSGHGRDYVLAVLSANNPSEGYGIETVDHVASTIYAELRPGA
jgi:beta-lactamase class A